MPGIKNNERPIMKIKFDDDRKHITILDNNRRMRIYHDPEDIVNDTIGFVKIDSIAGVRDRTDGKCIMYYYNCHCIAEENGVVCNEQFIVPRSYLQANKDNQYLSCGCIDYKKYETDIIDDGNIYSGVKPIKYTRWEYSKTRLKNGRRERKYYYKCRCEKHGLEYELSREYLFRDHKYCPCIMNAYKAVSTSFKNSFRAMHDRCYNKNHDAYINYGGRGIKICDRWKNDLYFFMIDKYVSYCKKVEECGGDEFEVSIDRIDVNGDYTPENTKWSTDAEQNRNRRNTKYYDFNGNKYNVHDLLVNFCDPGMTYTLLRERLRRCKSMCVNDTIINADIFKYPKYREEQESKGLTSPIHYTSDIDKYKNIELPTTFNFMSKEEAFKKD